MSRILTVARSGRVGLALGRRRHQHQVGRLEVAVDHAQLVNVLQAHERLVNEPHRFGRGGRPLAALQRLLRAFRLPGTPSRGNEAVRLPDLKRAHHVGVLEAQGQPGLALKAPSMSGFLARDGGNTLMATVWPSVCTAL